MAYVRKAQPAGPLVSAEQVRHRNAQMRLELIPLMAERADLEAKTQQLRAELTKARRKLTRQIKDLDAVRAQTAHIAAATDYTPAPNKYGGREGLEAAVREIEGYEGDKLGTVPRKGPSHGTGRKYRLGCRCESCIKWRKSKSATAVETQRQKREEYYALKQAAEAA